MAVLHNQRTHIHKERRQICDIVDQHATAMAQQAQEPARWLSAKSRNKNRRAISHYKIAGTRARHTHPSDYKRLEQLIHHKWIMVAAVAHIQGVKCEVQLLQPLE